LPGCLFEARQRPKSRFSQDFLAEQGRTTTGAKHGPIEGTGKVDLPALDPDQPHITASAHSHLQHTGRECGSFSGQHTTCANTTTGLDARADLSLVIDGAVAETRSDQHHLGADTPPRSFFLQHHLPVWF
jgi:hypothetical protein